MKITAAIRKAVMRDAASRGGKKRAQTLTKAELSAIGKQGAKARWAKHRRRSPSPETK